MDDSLESSFLRVLELACDLEEEESSYSGLLKGEHLFRKFEDELHRIGIKFSVKCRSKGAKPGSTKSKRILFEYKSGHKIPFLGHPFTIEDTVYKNCHLGGRERITEQQGDNKEDLRRVSKKQGCEAIFIIKKLDVYAGIEVERGDDRLTDYLNKEWALRKVKSGDYPTACWFRFQISKPQYHNHNFGEEILRFHTIHPLLAEKVKELVKEGMKKPEKVKDALNHYVQNDLLRHSSVIPTSVNASFYPPIKAIRNAVARAIQSEKYSKIDDKQLIKMVKEWSKEDHVFYRPCQKRSYLPPEDQSMEGSNDADDDPCNYYEKFIVVHQTLWQQEMLKKYGETCIIDPTYKTIKYSLPLYFLIVKTNLGYIIVATFAMQYETSNSISEALGVIKSWNSNWHPLYLLSDGRDVVTNAFLIAFPECDVFICDFYREKMWLQWLHRNGDAAPEELFEMWKKLAESVSREEFNSALSEMHKSPMWRENSKAQDYLTLEWFHSQAMWVHFYRPFELQWNINMNNGVEEHKKFLNHTSLTHHINKTISCLMKVIVGNQLVEAFRNYIHGNVKVSSGYARHKDKIHPRYEDKILGWLQNRPYAFTKHVVTRWSAATTEYHHIEEIPDSATFHVKSSAEDHTEELWQATPQYFVDLEKPSCTCYDFRKWFYPCKHICAILIFVSSISVSVLPSHYLKSPYLNLDSGVVCNLPQDGTDDGLTADALACDQHDHSYQLSESGSPSDQSPRSLASAKSKCRTMLEEMSNLTYLMNDPARLERVMQQLQPIMSEMGEGVVLESDIIVEISPSQKRQSSQEPQPGKKSKILD